MSRVFGKEKELNGAVVAAAVGEVAVGTIHGVRGIQGRLQDDGSHPVEVLRQDEKSIPIFRPGEVADTATAGTERCPNPLLHQFQGRLPCPAPRFIAGE